MTKHELRLIIIQRVLRIQQEQATTRRLEYIFEQGDTVVVTFPKTKIKGIIIKILEGENKNLAKIKVMPFMKKFQEIFVLEKNLRLSRVLLIEKIPIEL